MSLSFPGFGASPVSNLLNLSPWSHIPEIRQRVAPFVPFVGLTPQLRQLVGPPAPVVRRPNLGIPSSQAGLMWARSKVQQAQAPVYDPVPAAQATIEGSLTPEDVENWRTALQLYGQAIQRHVNVELGAQEAGFLTQFLAAREVF